jgi:hypothetical protein
MPALLLGVYGLEMREGIQNLHAPPQLTARPP